jgi:hypothetical protein
MTILASISRTPRDADRSGGHRCREFARSPSLM